MKNDNGTRRILLFGVVGLGIFGASGARAQLPSALAPSVTLTIPWLLPGEPTGNVGLSSSLGAAARLSFQGGIPHQIGGGPASCVSLEDPAGAAVGFPVQRFTSARLSPALVLHGFSSAGCPVHVQNDAWNDLTNELHGGSAPPVGAGRQGISFGGAAW